MKGLLKIVAVRLSANPSTPVVDDENGVNGKINVGSDGRQFFTVEFQDSTNPFAPVKSRNFWQAEIGKWTAITPKVAMSLVGKTVPGQIINAPCESYSLTGNDGVERTFTSITCIQLGHESAELAVRATGRKPAIANIVAEAEEAPLF